MSSGSMQIAVYLTYGSSLMIWLAYENHEEVDLMNFTKNLDEVLISMSMQRVQKDGTQSVDALHYGTYSTSHLSSVFG